MRHDRYLRAGRDAKGKAAISSNSKLMLNVPWNESKKPDCDGSKYRALPGNLRELVPASAAVAATPTTVTPSAAAVTAATVPAAGSSQRGGMIGSVTVAAEPGKDAPAIAAGIVTGTV